MRTTTHVLSTIDGRISGGFMTTPKTAEARAAYGRIRKEMNADGLLYGSVTARAFAGEPPARPMKGAVVPEGDFVTDAARRFEGEYVVVLDLQGEVWWTDPILRRPGRPDAAVIEVVCGSTPPEFLAYLRKEGISYLMAGHDALDCHGLIGKLERLLGIRTLLICGGGIADWTLLQAGCVDEVSIVMAPLASGEQGAATIFDQMPGLTEGAPVSLELVEATPLKGNSVHLRYRTRR